MKALEMTFCDTPAAAASRDILATKLPKSPPHWAAPAGQANSATKSVAAIGILTIASPLSKNRSLHPPARLCGRKMASRRRSRPRRREQSKARCARAGHARKVAAVRLAQRLEHPRDHRLKLDGSG